jgi:hypothetical protein
MRFFNPILVWSGVGIASKTSRTVRSVQQGTIVLSGVASNTATITSVDTTRSVCLYGGTSTTGTADQGLVRVSVTDATTVTATRQSASNDATVSYTVVEFY